MAASLPDYDDIVTLLAQRGVPEYKIYHSIAVEAVAMHLVDEIHKSGYPVDRSVVSRGALLHDIGISLTGDDLTPNHCAVGGRIARGLGYPEQVARCIECHEGIFSSETGRDLQVDMVREHYRPETWAEKAVFYADHSLLVFGECDVDPWSDRYSLARAKYPYLVKVYNRWAGQEIAPGHRDMIATQQLDDEMRQFLTPEAIERVRPKVEEMRSAFSRAGIQFPFDYAADIQIPF
jgi:putative nucleotidyltransferase with HDIG domain